MKYGISTNKRQDDQIMFSNPCPLEDRWAGFLRENRRSLQILGGTIIILPMRLPPVVAFLAVLILMACATPRPWTNITEGTVTFRLLAPGVTTVAVAGSFNRWDLLSHPLTGPDGHGVWTLALPLPEGRYEYQFIINGDKWITDPHAPTVDDGLGGKNSTIMVEK
jgi:hypothetical protein